MDVEKKTSLGAIVLCPVYYLRCFIRRMLRTIPKCVEGPKMGLESGEG